MCVTQPEQQDMEKEDSSIIEEFGPLEEDNEEEEEAEEVHWRRRAHEVEGPIEEEQSEELQHNAASAPPVDNYFGGAIIQYKEIEPLNYGGTQLHPFTTIPPLSRSMRTQSSASPSLFLCKSAN